MFYTITLNINPTTVVVWRAHKKVPKVLSGSADWLSFLSAKSQHFGGPDSLCPAVCRPLDVDSVGLVGGLLLRDLGAPAAAQLEAEGRRRLLEGGLSLALPFKGQIDSHAVTEDEAGCGLH